MTLLPETPGPGALAAASPALPFRAVPGENIDASPTGTPLTGAGRPQVVLLTEGTYPHAHGGVSVWCDQLVRGLPEIPFAVVALVAFGYQRPVWDLPDHVVRLDTVGLWEVARERRPTPGDEPPPHARMLASLLAAPRDDLPGFRRFLDVVSRSPVGTVTDDLRFGHLLTALDEALRRPRSGPLTRLRAADLVQVAEMLAHMLRSLAVDPGPAAIYHASSNGLAALAGMAACRRHGGRFLLTEHGIYLRERYLELRRTPLSHAAKALLIRFHRLVNAAAYAEAAVIAPGSQWNQRWESRYGAPATRLRTIYNGIDPDEFPVQSAAEREASEAVVSWLGRVDPIKDLDTLVRAFAVVHAARPDARLRLHGRTPAGNEGYRAEIDALVTELGLDGVATFAGGVAASADAYAGAQVGVLSSISEGFPYSLIEAMACGLPTVSTGVGGVPEAVADAGLVVPPRAPDLLGAALLELLDDPDRRARMGRLARERVVGLFTLEHCLEGYRALYRELDTAPPTLTVTGADAEHASAGTGPAGAGPGDGTVRLDTGEQAKVVAAVGGPEAMAGAVDAEEVAATLESVGVTDQVAAASFATRDVFTLAERAWARALADTARPGTGAPPPPPPTVVPAATVRGAVGRGLAYTLPAVVVAAATIAGAPQAMLVAASVLGWGLAQGGGVLAYTALHRTTAPSGLGPVRRALAVAAATVATAGAGVAAVASPADGLAFALPLLHLLGATALVMARRTRVLLAALVPVAAVSAGALAAPDSALPGLAAPLAGATVAATLGIVAAIARRDPPPPARVLSPVDWARAVPLVLGGWATATFALLAVSAVSHLPAFHGVDSRQWLLVALPLWVMVAGCEWLLLRANRTLRRLLDATPTVALWRASARWAVAQWLGLAVGALQAATVLAAGLASASGLPRHAALTSASIFLLVALTLVGVTVLTAAGRSAVAGLVVAAAAALLGGLAATPYDVAGAGDHVAALAICGVTAVSLCVAAARTLVDPASHR